MLKLGVCHPHELDREHLSGFFGSRKFVSAELYPLACELEPPDRDLVLARILARFPTRNQTLKRTQSTRFASFDAALADQIAEHFGGKRIEIHDTAVSDGRTAVDLFRALAEHEGLDFSYLASDYAPDVQVVRDDRSSLRVVRDPTDDVLLQVVQPPFVFNVRQGESPFLYPVNRAVLAILLRRRVPDLLARLARGDPGLSTTRVRLLHPSCLALERDDPRFRFERHDLLEPPKRVFDVVRAMNVLNRSYFDHNDLRRAIGNLAASLRPGGLLATGSNEDAGSVVDGGFYRRTEHGFERLASSGAGSPVDDLIPSG
jgi:hypothetical protein